MRIDAHQHFWRYSQAEYGWIDENLSQLRRDFLPGDLRPELDAAGIDACIAVQARQDEDETAWLLALADEHPWIAGVVGWCDLRSGAVEDALESLRAHDRLVGLRHVVQDEPEDNFLLRADFCRGIERLAGSGLVYDVLVYPRQLPAAVEFAGRFPEQPMVLDHLAKPEVRANRREPWQEHMRALAAHENVAVKLSGLATEADWKAWTPEVLAPYLDAVLAAFGPERVLFGSDWPVCLLATGYARWHAVLRDWSEALSQPERAALFGGNAARIYGLETPAP